MPVGAYHLESCFCVPPNLAAREYALDELVRPWEVEFLLTPGRSSVATADGVSAWLTEALWSGELRYIPDPPDCDRWCSPAVTYARGGGDCDDLAIFIASLVQALGCSARVETGWYHSGRQLLGHAWVEGVDEIGPFLIEATSGEHFRWLRPTRYLRLTG